MKKNNIFHLVETSPWPIISSINANIFIISLVTILKTKINTPYLLRLTLVISSSIIWWSSVKRERSLLGLHNKPILKTLKLRFALFIISEALLFTSIFWNFLHNSLSPAIDLGRYWPPNTTLIANPYLLPTYGTILLLSSRIFLTKAHHSITIKTTKTSNINKNILKTIILGLLFLDIQITEYTQSNFAITTFNESSFRRIFFLTTGLHGSHVLIGVIFLTYTLIFNLNFNISPTKHTRLEIATWYWHFVDIVWLFVFTLIYWINA